jgi:adenylate cyclase class 2
MSRGFLFAKKRIKIKPKDRRNMNIEIEKKFRVQDFNKTKEKIESLGSDFKKTKETNDRYFEVPQRTKRTKYLRIRFNNDQEDGTLAYHEVIDNLQTKEWEIDVNDTRIGQQILEKLGFQPEVDVKKKRLVYILDNAKILLDEVENLGSFVEIEAPDEKTLEKIVQKLDLDEKDIVSGAGYPDLIKEKNERTTK